MGWIFKPGWLLAVHCLSQIAMKKGVFHIQLVNGPVASER
jgi:hypothetical protein